MPKRNLIWILAFAAAAIIMLLVSQNHTIINEIPGTPAKFDPVAEAYRTIIDNYYYPVDDNVLRREAIGAMVAKLDEYSRYFPSGKSELFADRMEGLECGVGLKLDFTGGRCTILGPLPHSPAHEAGLCRGDRILEIDGLDAGEMTPAAVNEMLQSPGTAEVAITVMREDQKRTFRLARGRFPVESIEGLYRGAAGAWVYMADNAAGIAYIRIKEILPRTAEHLQSALRQIEPIRALVLDLRDNPGGGLAGAVEIADLFLREGTIVTVINNKHQLERHVAHERGTAPDNISIAVLINGNTASAAEIVAGALENNGRAAMVGRRTCGKGCIQSMIVLPGNLGRMNLTTAEFYIDPARPVAKAKGRKTWGVAPHVEVDLSSEAAAQLARLHAAEQVLHPYHSTTLPSTLPADFDKDSPTMAMKLDAQLQAAIALLRSPARYTEVMAEAAAQRVRARQAATQPATAATP